MEIQEIEVTIDKDGQVQIQVRGVKGLQCLEITKDLELALGGQIEARIMTAESTEDEVSPDIDQDQQLKSA